MAAELSWRRSVRTRPAVRPGRVVAGSGVTRPQPISRPRRPTADRWPSPRPPHSVQVTQPILRPPAGRRWSRLAVGHLLTGHGGPDATGRSLGAYSDEQLALFLDCSTACTSYPAAGQPVHHTPSAREVSPAVVIVLELAGAVSILAAFTSVSCACSTSTRSPTCSSPGSARRAGGDHLRGGALGLPAPGGRWSIVSAVSLVASIAAAGG